MTMLSNILTSLDKMKVDAERQVRVWSGTLHNNKDYEDAIQDMLPIFAAPMEPNNTSNETAGEVSEVVQQLDGNDMEIFKYIYETQNAAFGAAMPKYNVESRLGEIKARNTLQI